MNRDQALAKIKKCLSLAKSGNTNEAAIALRQARKLMDEHRITEKDVSLTDVNEARAKASSPALNRWEVALKNMIAEAFGCSAFSELTADYSPAGARRRTRVYVFVGMLSAPTVAAYAFEVLSRQCAKARLAHIAKQSRNCKPITKTARGDAFAEGWVIAVASLIDRFANPLGDEQLLLEYMAERHPDLVKSKTRSAAVGRKVNDGHRWAGHRAGQHAQLERGIGGLEERALLS